MGQYKLTTRGRIVLYAFAIIVILLFLLNMNSDRTADDLTDVNEVVLNDEPSAGEDDKSNEPDESDKTVDVDEVSGEKPDSTESVESIQDTEGLDLDELTASDEIKLMNSGFSIYFKPNKYVLDEDTKAQLDEFISVAKDYKDIDINIESYSMSSAIATNHDDSYEICEKRSSSVKEYLLGEGIAEERIYVMNYGDSRPVTDSKDAESAWMNMRSDVFFAGYKSYK